MMKKSLLSALCLGMVLAIAATPVWAVALSEVIRTLEEPFQSDTDQNYRISDYSADFFQESKIASLNRLQRANGRVEVAFDYQEHGVPKVKFRWQYDQPTTQEIVSDGKTMWVYLPENNQVIQSNIELINKANQHDPMTFLTGLGNLSRDFTISWGSPNRDVDNNYVLEMTPRRISSLINKLVIVVDRYAVEAYQNRGKETDQDNPRMVPPTPQDPRLPSPQQDPLATLQRPGFPGSEFPRPGFDRGFGQGFDGAWFPILSTAVYDPNGNSTIIEFSNLRVNYGISDMTFNFITPAGVQVVRPTGKEMGF